MFKTHQILRIRPLSGFRMIFLILKLLYSRLDAAADVYQRDSQRAGHERRSK